MKEVNTNIIYTKVSPTEYIGEFTVSPEETTDYELRAIDDNTVVEKCEVQVEDSPVYNTTVWFAHVPYNPDDELHKTSIENGAELSLTDRGVYVGIDSETSQMFQYEVFNTTTKDPSQLVTPVSSGTILSNTEDTNNLLSLGIKYGTGFRGIIITLEDSSNFIIWVKDEQEDPRPINP